MDRSLAAEAPRLDVTELGRLLFYPVFATARIVVLAWLFLAFGAGFAPVILGFSVGGFLLLVLAEKWIPYRRDWSIRGDPQWRNDLGHSVAYILNNGPVFRALLLGTLIAAWGDGGIRLWAGVWPDAWPYAAQVALVIVLDDALEYALHRALHTWSWLWPMHVLHHTPDRLHVLKTLRHSFPLAWLRGLAVMIPIVALGAPLEIAAWGPAALFVFGPLAHANLDVRLPRWVHRVLNTPQVHRIHHSIDPAVGASNYCFVFPIWDMLFGTYRAPEREGVVDTGLREDPVPSGFWRQLAIPFTLRGPTGA